MALKRRSQLNPTRKLDQVRLLDALLLIWLQRLSTKGGGGGEHTWNGVDAFKVKQLIHLKALKVQCFRRSRGLRSACKTRVQKSSFAGEKAAAGLRRDGGLSRWQQVLLQTQLAVFAGGKPALVAALMTPAGPVGKSELPGTLPWDFFFSQSSLYFPLFPPFMSSQPFNFCFSLQSN